MNDVKEYDFVEYATSIIDILHKGFVPNLPIFQNTAVATVWDDGKRFALRTKSQLLDFIEKTDYPFEMISATVLQSYQH